MAFPYTNALGTVLNYSGASKKVFYGTSAADNLLGTTANDIMRGYGGGDTYTGGLGDDIYCISSLKDRVVELAGEGVDTIRSTVYHILEANVENLVLEGKNAWYGGGNDLDNVIVGNEYDQQLDGGKGNDVLVGGDGADTFIISAGNGSDVIQDFTSGLDQIRLGGYGITAFSQIKSIASQVGADTVLNFANGEKLVLRGVTASNLTSGDFNYQLDTAKLKLSFSDDFNSLSLYSQGGTWRTEYGHGGTGTIASHTLAGESEIYMDPEWAGTGSKPLGVNPFSIDSGVLTITAAPTSAEVLPYVDGHTYTSGLLTSKFTFSQQYGYFEIRAKLPDGAGMWPAFWLLPTDSTWPPELDVFEMLGNDPNVVYLTTHGIDGSANTSVQDRVVVDTSQFHTYGVDWNSDRVIYYIDGVAVAEQPTPAVMNKEMYLLMNLAVGGSGSWGGGPDAQTGTGKMQIDYVKAYRTVDTVSTTINGQHTTYDGSDFVKAASVTPPAQTAAAQTFTGTSGNDVYQVGNAQDKISESTGGGNDSVVASVSYVLPANVETLTLAGDAALNGTGNELANRLFGNSAANVLSGLAGNDYFDGQGGNDTLIGGTGDDTYVVNDVMTRVIENPGEGTDTIQTSISYVLPNAVENLRLTGTADITATGNADANRMIGNSGSNVLSGLGGNDYLDGQGGSDTLIGGKGDDVMVVDNGTTTVIEQAGEGTDTVQASITYKLPANVEILRLTGTADINGAGNELANKLFGNSGANHLAGGAGNDIIDGGAGDDMIAGGAGNDTLTGGVGADQFVFAGGFGIDTVTDFAAGQDKLVLVGTSTSSVTITTQGANTIVTVGTDKITLTGSAHIEMSDITFVNDGGYMASMGLVA
ncbi:family 16 glycosylhydrolase [Novosphingobium clariflavum]|uniref:Family 16 glycosylhydrolase n=1 Tax=Novosphingobium clariflavum TaxID=2029884 RepID=A0ABV6S9H0_9SPHN|nr:family 16 glycosylhydrolase [Novosphingobium clariflavum]